MHTAPTTTAPTTTPADLAALASAWLDAEAMAERAACEAAEARRRLLAAVEADAT